MSIDIESELPEIIDGDTGWYVEGGNDDGLGAYGPFASKAHAELWAESELDGDWELEYRVDGVVQLMPKTLQSINESRGQEYGERVVNALAKDDTIVIATDTNGGQWLVQVLGEGKCRDLVPEYFKVPGFILARLARGAAREEI